MGIFATYAGFIYNDFLSLPWNLFGSCWTHNHENPEEAELIEDCVNPIGMDPKWYNASNELAFFNSYKMKLAVIIGVLQMSWGLILRAMNCIHFSLWLDLIFEFFPMIIFMACTFGYMIFMIFLKWTINYSEDT